MHSHNIRKLFRFEGADGKYICEAHQHSSVEIFALREGKVDFYLGDKKYVLPAGKFIIVNSNEVHSIHTSGRNEAIVLQIPMEKQIMRFSGEKKEEDGKLFALLEKMYRQQIRKEYGYELLMQSIFYQLSVHFLQVMQKIFRALPFFRRKTRIICFSIGICKTIASFRPDV